MSITPNMHKTFLITFFQKIFPQRNASKESKRRHHINKTTEKQKSEKNNNMIIKVFGDFRKTKPFVEVKK